LTMYNVPVGSYNPTSPANPIAGQICPGGVCPAAWLTASFAAGAAVDDPLTLFNESTATLVSTVSSLTQPLTGTGDGELELTGGTAASKFVDGPGPDFSIQSNLQSCPVPVGNPFAPNCAVAGAWPEQGPPEQDAGARRAHGHPDPWLAAAWRPDPCDRTRRAGPGPWANFAQAQEPPFLLPPRRPGPGAPATPRLDWSTCLHPSTSP